MGKRKVILLVLGTLIGGAWLGLFAQGTEEEISPELKIKIEALIKKLGDDDWQTREKAQKELEEIGASAEPSLKKALQTSDPEIVHRVHQILEAIVSNKYRTELQKLSNKIAFIGEEDGAIWLMNADGANLKRLTNPPANPVTSFVWSPDGQKIACVMVEQGSPEIWVLDADGQNQRKLTENTHFISWSPDSKKITFDSTQISIVDIDGKNQLDLSQGTAPVWSPNGLKIAFIGNDDQVYIMDINGENQTRLTNMQHGGNIPVPNLFWSPDSKKILLQLMVLQPRNYEIYIMDADGRNQINLTNHPANDSCPDWSPDSKRIAFRSARDGNYEIYVIDVETKSLTRLTNNKGTDTDPCWSPDGKHIAFISDREKEGQFQIYMMDPAGKCQVQLTQNGGSRPAWQPRAKTPEVK